MIFDLNKFKYIHVTKGDVQEIIALAKYKGKTFRGVAKCHPDDNFDEETGRELAARRCDLAIRRARLRDRMKTEKSARIAAREACNVEELAIDKRFEAEKELFNAQEEYADYILRILSFTFAFARIV